MDYEQLLQLSPFGIDQQTKEQWYCEMFEKLTKEHKNKCEKYNRFLKSFDHKETFETIEEIPMLPVGLFKPAHSKYPKSFWMKKMQRSSKEHWQRSWKK